MPAARVPQPHEWMNARTCTRCHERKPWALFAPKEYTPDGLVCGVQSWCRDCYAAKRKEDRALMRKAHKPAPGCERIPEPWEYVRTAVCSHCGLTKTFAFFSPKSYWPDGSVRSVQSRCKDCCNKLRDRAKQKEWHRANRPSINARNIVALRKRRQGMRRDRTSRGKLLPATPFQLWLLDVQREEGSLARLAEDAGLHEDTLAKVLSRNVTVAEVTVERSVCARGLRLDDVYRGEMAA